MRFFTSAALILSALAGLSTSKLLPICQTESQPNPIADQYPNDVTGTINGTVAILPIPYHLARSIIPKQYAILDKQCKLFLDGTVFPKDMYPAVLQTGLDHDLSSPMVSVADFSRAGISFPFVDRLSDGCVPNSSNRNNISLLILHPPRASADISHSYTAMTYADTMLISAANALALAGSAAYGYLVTPALFDPPCDAYVCTGIDCSSTSFTATAALSLNNDPAISQQFDNTCDVPAYSLEL